MAMDGVPLEDWIGNESEHYGYYYDQTHRNLSYSSIGAEGAEALSKSLSSLTALQHLNLSYSSIGAEGAVALSKSLPSLTALQHLNLSGNSIEAEGAVALSKSLPSLTR